MKPPSNRSVYLVGVVVGAIGFFVAWDGFFWLLRELGYVDAGPGSTFISILFLACMFLMCAGYGIGIAMFVSKKIWGRV